MFEQEIINLAYKIHENVESELGTKIEEVNLRRKELDVLLCIDELDTPTTPSDISKHTKILLPLVSRILDSLVKRSILESTRGKVDRRQNFISATPKGIQLTNTCKEVLGKLPPTLLKGLSENEKKALSTLL